MKGLEYTYTSRQFALMARQIAGDTLALLSPRAAQRIGEFMEHHEPDIAVKTSFGILDRAGHSPQAVALTINQQTNVQVSIAPLFSEDYSERVKKFLNLEPKVIDAG